MFDTGQTFCKQVRVVSEVKPETNPRDYSSQAHHVKHKLTLMSTDAIKAHESMNQLTYKNLRKLAADYSDHNIFNK